MKRTNNRIVVDLKKCQWAQLVWRNQEGMIVHTKPDCKTMNGIALTDNIIFMSNPRETQLERAIRLMRLDTWTPELRLELSANHRLIYTGDKALSIWKEWCARTFSNNKTK